MFKHFQEKREKRCGLFWCEEKCYRRKVHGRYPCNHWIAWYNVKPCIAWDQSCNHCAAREKAGQAMVTFRKFELSTLLVISLRILCGFYRSFN